MEKILEIYNKLKGELSDLEERLLTLKNDEESSAVQYFNTCEKLEVKELTLYALKEQIKTMPTSEYSSIEKRKDILASIINVVLLLVYLYVFNFHLPAFNAIVEVLLMLGGTVGIVLSVACSSRFISNKLKKRSYEKIINSTGYQRISDLVKELEDEIVILMDEKVQQKAVYDEYNVKYSSLETKIMNIKSLLDYIENEIISQEDKVLEEQVSKKRVKSKNNGNIE